MLWNHTSESTIKFTKSMTVLKQLMDSQWKWLSRSICSKEPVLTPILNRFTRNLTILIIFFGMPFLMVKWNINSGRLHWLKIEPNNWWKWISVENLIRWHMKNNMKSLTQQSLNNFLMIKIGEKKWSTVWESPKLILLLRIPQERYGQDMTV